MLKHYDDGDHAATENSFAKRPPSSDWDDLREQRVRFLAHGLAETLEELEQVRRQRDIARRLVRNLRAELYAVRGAA